MIDFILHKISLWGDLRMYHIFRCTAQLHVMHCMARWNIIPLASLIHCYSLASQATWHITDSATFRKRRKWKGKVKNTLCSQFFWNASTSNYINCAGTAAIHNQVKISIVLLCLDVMIEAAAAGIKLSHTSSTTKIMLRLWSFFITAKM